MSGRILLAAVALVAGGPPSSGPALLPNVPVLRRQILIGDLARLRAAYPRAADYRRALAGVWLPDALAGATTPAWREAFGIDLASVDRFAAGGFHPAELLVARGRFRPDAVGAALRRHRYTRANGLWARGADGSIDATTSTGRIALSSLDRVSVTPDRLVAASTTALAATALGRGPSLAGDPDLAAAIGALDRTTAAAFFPATQIRPVEGVPITPIVERSARLLAAGVDDRGPVKRTLKIALVYASSGDARTDAKLLGARLPRTTLSDAPRLRFDDIVGGLQARVVAARVVLVSGRLRVGQNPGIWRSLLERGDLAVLVRRPVPGG